MPSGILQDFREIYIICFQASCSFANSSQNKFGLGFHLLRFLQALFLVFLQKVLSRLLLELLLGFLQHFSESCFLRMISKRYAGTNERIFERILAGIPEQILGRSSKRIPGAIEI